MLAHVLARGAYGDVARSLSLGLAVAQLTMAGLAPTVARAVAAGADDAARWARAAGSLRLVLLASAGCAVLVVPLAALGLAPWSAAPVAEAALVAAVYAVYFALKCVLFALDEVALYARWELVSDVLFFAVLTALAVAAPHVALLTFSIAYGVFVAGVARLVLTRPPTRERVALDRRYAGLATLATYASVARLPLLTAVVGAVAGSRDAAGVAAVVAIVMPLFLVPQAAGMLTFATFARAPGSRHGAELRRAVRTVGLLSAAVVVPMALLAHPLVSILLGSSYRGVAPSLAIVALGSLPQLVGTPVGNAISGEGAVGVNAAIGAVSLVVALGGAAALAPRYHVTGAAVALAASMVVLGTSTLVAGWARYAERLPRAVGSHS
ncbi:MAG TPA: hypothetical protein VGC78_08325 [Gaiellaceae bacterium]